MPKFWKVDPASWRVRAGHEARTALWMLVAFIAFAAQGQALTQTYIVNANFSSGPLTRVSGSFTITFDPNANVHDQPFGLSALTLNITSGPVGYTNQPARFDSMGNQQTTAQLQIGGLSGGVVAIDQAAAYDFVLAMNNPAGTPSFVTLIYRQDGANYQSRNGCVIPAAPISPYGNGPYSKDGKPTNMNAAFIPLSSVGGSPAGLDSAASACGFQGFGWIQTVQSMAASLMKPKYRTYLDSSGLPVLSVDPASLDALGYLKAPHSFPDPPKGGYANDPAGTPDSFPFYWPVPGWNVGKIPCTPYVAAQTAFVLRFQDCPGNPVYSPQPAPTMTFSTSLVGVLPTGDLVIPFTSSPPLFTWTWQSDFNGDGVGGIPQFRSVLAVDATSGKGGGSLTSINNIQLPTAVSPSQVATSMSGLSYNRVGKTLTGTVTLTNVGAATVAGPLQVLFTALPSGVTIANASGNLAGTPYLTIPSQSGVAPGQSLAASVQVTLPAGAAVTVIPAIHSGTISN